MSIPWQTSSTDRKSTSRWYERDIATLTESANLRRLAFAEAHVSGMARGLRYWALIFVTITGRVPAVVAAQDSTARPPIPKAAAATVEQPTLPSLAQVRVLSVERWDHDVDDQHPGAVAAGIGHIIILTVRGLRSLADVATCESAAGQRVERCTPTPIALFLDGREMKGLLPESGAPEVDSGKVRFHLERTPESDEVWADLLGEPRFRSGTFFHRPTEASVGLAGGYALPTEVHRGPGGLTSFHLIRIHRMRFVIASILFFIFLGISYWLARMTCLLRMTGDPIPSTQAAAPVSAVGPAATTPAIPVRKRAWWTPPEDLLPYSLGRWQMAVWFVLVIGAFGYIWIVTGASDTITPTVLTLLGIGAGTALGAAAIDSAQMSSASDRIASVLRDRTSYALRIDALEKDGRPSQTPDKASELATLRTLVEKADGDIHKLKTAMRPATSNGWWYDMIRDENGAHSFHRFQIFIWTIVLVFLFVYSVWSRLSMPEFGTTLLAVMGISGGTYLGFKLPEKQT
jgi:hypothetical protein